MDLERYDLMELTSVATSQLVVQDSGAVLCLCVSADQVLRLYRIVPAAHSATTVMLVAKWSSSRRGKVHAMLCGCSRMQWCIVSTEQLGIQCSHCVLQQHIHTVILCIASSVSANSSELLKGILVYVLRVLATSP